MRAGRRRGEIGVARRYIVKSGGGPPQSKTLARWPKTLETRKASWSAPVLPPLRRAKAPLRRDGGWRFGLGAGVKGNVGSGVLRLTEELSGILERCENLAGG